MITRVFDVDVAERIHNAAALIGTSSEQALDRFHPEVGLVGPRRVLNGSCASPTRTASCGMRVAGFHPPCRRASS